MKVSAEAKFTLVYYFRNKRVGSIELLTGDPVQAHMCAANAGRMATLIPARWSRVTLEAVYTIA